MFIILNSVSEQIIAIYSSLERTILEDIPIFSNVFIYSKNNSLFLLIYVLYISYFSTFRGNNNSITCSPSSPTTKANYSSLVTDTSLLSIYVVDKMSIIQGLVRFYMSITKS